MVAKGEGGSVRGGGGGKEEEQRATGEAGFY